MLRRVVVSAVLLLVACPLAASAQDTSLAIELRLRSALRPGDRVTVTLADGSVLQGRMREVTRAGLLVDPGDGRQPVRAPLGYIDRAQRRRNGIKLGAIVGGIASAPPAILILVQLSGSATTRSGPGLAALTVLGGIGAGIGIDALLSTNRTIYARNDIAVKVTLLPSLDLTGGGAGFRIVF
jgi:hypothetical protein